MTKNIETARDLIGQFNPGLFGSLSESERKSKLPNWSNSDGQRSDRISERSDRAANNRFGGEIRNPNEVEMGL